ncbi:MAG: phosphagen kinase [Rhizobiaceae bacterium]
MNDKLNLIKSLQASQPGNIAIQCFDDDYYQSLDATKQLRLLKCLNSGLENPTSEVGCYANLPTDYDELKPFFEAVLSRYHRVPIGTKHINNWSLDSIEGLPGNGKLDLTELGLPALSMRVRVGRNLANYPLPASMNLEQRVELENNMIEAFQQLIDHPKYGGGYFSLTPGSKNFINDNQYHALIKEHIMFKNMDEDSYLTAAGIAADWPHGRGCYISKDRGFIIWVGEEDHLRIMCMEKGSVLNTVFDRLKNALDVINNIEGLTFATSKDFGIVTSCPTNLGTAMRASIHIPLPNLTAGGSDARAKQIARPLGLSVRGIGGEHTPVGDDGTVDISPSARFCITEGEILASLYQGIALLKAEEDQLTSS